MRYIKSKTNLVILLAMMAVMSSCSNKLMIKSSVSESKSIDKNAIAKIKFSSQGYCASAKSVQVISAELENLKNKLLNWDSKSLLTKADMKAMFKEVVLNLNEFARLDSGNIQTDEREWIWSEFEKMGAILEFEELDGYFDDWRDW